MAKETSFFAL